MEKERISASAAVQKVNLQFRNPRRAAALIEERAAFGLIQAHAKLMVVTRKTRGPDVITEHRDCEVPRWVWQAREQQSAASEFDWSADRYTAFRLAYSDVRHRAVERVELFGVEFGAEGIAKLLPDPASPDSLPEDRVAVPTAKATRPGGDQAQPVTRRPKASDLDKWVRDGLKAGKSCRRLVDESLTAFTLNVIPTREQIRERYTRVHVEIYGCEPRAGYAPGARQ